MRDISSPLDGFSSPFGPQRNRTLQSLLFGQTEPGFTFEPWDITTLYQDRAGTTPVTAAGQSVGLRLDKSQGLALGPEVNPDPGFDNPAAWTFGGATPGWAVTGGKAECTATAAGSRWVSMLGMLTVGAKYLITADVVVVSGGCAPDVSADAAGDATTSGAKRWIVTASTTTMQFIGRGGFVGSIDNVSFKTLAGNHEVAVSDAKRGVYGWMPKTGRRNLLTYTSFEGAVAGTPGTFPTSFPVNSGTGSIVSVSGDTIVFSATAARQIGGAAQSVAANAVEAWSITVTENSGLTFNQLFYAINLTGATLTAFANGVSVNPVTYVPLANDRLSIVLTNGAAAITPVFRIGVGVSGTATGQVGLKNPQREVGSTTTAYQRVVSQYDITEAGVPTCYYVQADGVDDAYVTPTITPNTDKVQVFAGVRKLSDSGYIAEMSVDASSNSGTLRLFAVTGGYNFQSRGTINAASASIAAGFAAPNTSVISGLGDISADSTTIRLNGTQVAQSTADQGTGNYLAYPAYIYSRGGTSLPFNGLDFGHAVRFGPNLDAATIARVESLIARNTPEVTL